MTTPVTGTTSTPTTATSSTSSSDAASAQLSSNFSTFLTLLTTQLKNQDPTSPMDSNQFTQQLVMYSQVEQQIDTNTNLKSLISQSASNAGAMATTYLGRNVSITNGQASLSGGTANWTYNLGSTAANTTLTVSNASNQVVYSSTGETASGNHSFAWDGKDNNGNALPDGAYKLAVNSKDSAGNTVTASVASAGTVSQIDMSSGTPLLVVGNMEVGVADITAIAN
jgi:flagellar basal-body rod modification protein FlgD